jgi:catechol 2,3-dioxygenase-like lactoylglutathione lyase family enzyme
VQLAKPRLDVGLYTNQLEPMLAFYQGELGLAFDHMLPLGRGLRQHRHDLAGSVLKINHARDPLPPAPPAGWRELLIAREGIASPTRLHDPDGNAVTLVPPGHQGITRIGLRLAARDLNKHRDFLGRALALDAADGDVYRLGDSVILLEEDPTATADVVREAVGFRYITVQVFKVDQEHAGILARGGREGMAPQTLGQTARISFVRDPDGNWIEISQRASLTGSLD